jgi:hypothetical protein
MVHGFDVLLYNQILIYRTFHIVLIYNVHMLFGNKDSHDAPVSQHKNTTQPTQYTDSVACGDKFWN